MIEKIWLKNFRSFRDETIRLKPFSVFIGPNGAGKSNLVSVFEFMGRAIREDVLVALSHLGGYDSVKHVKAGKDEPIEIYVGYRSRGEIPPAEKEIGRKRNRLFTYHFTVSQTEEGEPNVPLEWLRAKRPLLLREGAPWYYLKVDEKGGKVANLEGEYKERQKISETKLKKSSPYELALAGSRSLKGFPQVQSFYKFLSNWYISRFEPGRARESMKYSRAIRLASTGENLVLFIENMNKHHKDVLEDIVEVMKQKIPGFRNINVKHSPDGRLYLICIEEPENNIHPHLLEILVDEFRTASEKVQIIVTTHSPYLIDKCAPKEVFIIDKIDGESKISIPFKWMRGKLPVLKGRTLGECWYEGVFGGNP